MPKAFKEYQKRIGELDENAQVEALEQFLQLKACGEEQAREVIGGMNENQRRAIGEFIGKGTEPKIYARLFHDVWDNLDTDQKTFFINKFTLEDPELAIMIAPFVDLRRYVAEDPKDPESKFIRKSPARSYKPEDVARVSILDRYFNDFESARELMEDSLRVDSTGGLLTATEHYFERNQLFLRPYLPQLLEKAVVSQEAVEKLILNKWDRLSH